MLNSMRKGAGSWVAKIFLGLLVLSFGMWGVADYVVGGGDQTIAEIGDSEITGYDYRQQIQRDMQILGRRIGRVLTPEQAQAFGLYEAALQSLIRERLVDQASAEFGLAVGDDQVTSSIRTNPAFRNSLGDFDRFRFEQLLASNGLDEASYVQLMRRDLARSQLIGSVGVGVEKAPDVLVDAIYSYRREQRLARFIALPNSRIGDIGMPDDAALEAFHKDNEDRYTVPALRDIAYISVSPADLADPTQVNAEDLQAEYDARLEEFTTLERRTVDQMVFGDQAEAQTAFDRLQAGEAFAAVAKDMLQMEADDIALGALVEQDLPESLGKVAFGAGEDEVTAPHQTDFGWHVLHVSKIATGGTKSLEEVTESLRGDIALRLAADELVELMERLEDEVAGTGSIEQAAATVGLTVKSTGDIDAQGRRADGKTLADLPTMPGFVQTVFNADPGADPERIDGDDGGYLMFKVTSTKDPAIQPLADVRAKVIADWQAAERDRLNGEDAAKLVERLDNGTTLEEIAKEFRVDVVESGALTRTGPVGQETPLPVALQAALFEIDRGAATAAADTAKQSHYVARLTEIRPADAKADEQVRDRLAGQLADAFGNDLISQYRERLQDQIGVSIDNAAFAAATEGNI